jgi:iron donor protein CyaY
MTEIARIEITLAGNKIDGRTDIEHTEPTMALNPAFSEAEFRTALQKTFDRIEDAFSEVDPDVVECDQSHGALTLRLADRSRVILSAQPSVRQLWLALAARGTAVHFDFDLAQGKWVDDKGQGFELLAYLQTYLREATGVQLELG